MRLPDLTSINDGFSYSTKYVSPSSYICTKVNVAYAMFLSLQIGSVFTTVSIVSYISAPPFNIVDVIFAVSVAKMLALTPLPKPSAITTISLSLSLTTCTISPQSSSLYLTRL
ncbi:hypothetical protein SDC9_141422 [bioreactor metagenome]|uniref:Uncharacterized protein n=1 Tax=bioreactor metagenome TaxID=1076179 RepID=A0A645DY57_9ZZZZ